MPIRPAKTHILNRKNEDLASFISFTAMLTFHLATYSIRTTPSTSHDVSIHIFLVRASSLLMRSTVIPSRTIAVLKIVLHQDRQHPLPCMQHHTTKRLPSVAERCTKCYGQGAARNGLRPAERTRNLVGVY